ncbi:uncharacterized protein LOC144104207 [Amblyomma americanum]
MNFSCPELQRGTGVVEGLPFHPLHLWSRMRTLGTEHRILQWNQPRKKYGDSREPKARCERCGACRRDRQFLYHKGLYVTGEELPPIVGPKARQVQIFQASQSQSAPNSSSSDVQGTSRTGISTAQGVAPGEGITNEEQEAPCPRRSREEEGMATEKYHRWKPAYFSNETWRKLPDDLKKRYGNVNKDGSMKERKGVPTGEEEPMVVEPSEPYLKA